jgi:large subunit ribosomal protein L6
MSRIGKLPITVPNGVTVTQNGNTMTVKGPRGELTRSLPQAITVTLENGR